MGLEEGHGCHSQKIDGRRAVRERLSFLITLGLGCPPVSLSLTLAFSFLVGRYGNKVQDRSYIVMVPVEYVA